MNNKKYSSQSSHIVQDHTNHLQFKPHQHTIQRTHSLSKVNPNQPTFTPQINDMPFKIYPERTKTEVSRQQIV